MRSLGSAAFLPSATSTVHRTSCMATIIRTYSPSSPTSDPNTSWSGDAPASTNASRIWPRLPRCSGKYTSAFSSASTPSPQPSVDANVVTVPAALGILVATWAVLAAFRRATTVVFRLACYPCNSVTNSKPAIQFHALAIAPEIQASAATGALHGIRVSGIGEPL